MADRDLGGAFWSVWAASTVSTFGSGITALAVSVIVVETLRGSAFEVGIVRGSTWIAYLLLGLVVGAIVDRMRRKPLLIATDLGRAALLLAVPVLTWTGTLSVASLAAVVAILGLLALVGDAAAQSIVPRLVPTPLLMRAHARLDQSDAVAQTTGPAIAGALIAGLTAPVAVIVDAATFAASAVLLARTRIPEPRPPSAPLQRLGGEIREGLARVYRRGPLRALALDTHAWFICTAVAGTVLTAFALRTLSLDALGLGLALAVAGVGALAGSLMSVALGTRIGSGRVIIVCRAATGVGWGVVALATPGLGGWVVLAIGQALVGISMGAENANEMAYRQSVTPDRLQARVNTSMRSINRAAIVVGAPAGGLLADAFGYRPVLVAAAAGFLIVASALAASGFGRARVATDPPV